MFSKVVRFGVFYKSLIHNFVKFRNWKALQTKNVPRTKNERRDGWHHCSVQIWQLPIQKWHVNIQKSISREEVLWLVWCFSKVVSVSKDFVYKIIHGKTKVLTNTYNFAEDTTTIKKIPREIEIFAIFVWTAFKLVWRTVWTNRWQKKSSLVTGKFTTNLKQIKKK